MISLASGRPFSVPVLEFVFKGIGKRVKLNPPSGVTVQWALKGSYSLEHVVKFYAQVPAQPCALFPPKRKIFTLDDYSAHLDPAIKEPLSKRGYFLVILPGGITEDLQVNDTDLHHPLKASYREREAALMIKKLRENPDKIPSPSRDEIMKMCNAAFEETIAKIDGSDAFKRNCLSIKLDGSKDHLVSSKLKPLVWDEMKEFRSVLLSMPHPTTLKKLEEVMIPPDGVERKLDGVVDHVPPDEGYEVLDGELTEEEWDENENETVADSYDEEDIPVSENDVSTPKGESMPESESISVGPELKADVDCLSRIESALTRRRKVVLPTLFHFWSELKLC